jgi:hypothetical protein
MKRSYLVAYGYGQGAIWGYVLAESADEIERRYPKLTVVRRTPPWLSPEWQSRMEREQTFDIDDPDALRRAGLIA